MLVVIWWKQFRPWIHLKRIRFRIWSARWPVEYLVWMVIGQFLVLEGRRLVAKAANASGVLVEAVSDVDPLERQKVA